MRRILLLLTLCLLLPIQAHAKTLHGKVIGISDGDTIKILDHKIQYKIRLNGIDCPEKTQAFGQAAKQFTSKMSFGKMVEVENEGQDRYGRTLGVVFLPDGRNLNEELLSHGLAWHYVHYSKSKRLQTLEDAARRKKIGIWSQAAPQAPWEYRKKSKSRN